MLDYVEKKIHKYLNDLNIKNRDVKIQLAYSGGVDSSCLLDILMNLKDKLRISIYLTYVNYNTSEYSERVLQHIKKLSKAINKNIKTVNISSCENFESKARDIRYDFFSEIGKKNNIDLTFTAHHEKDQIETLIMQFINASDFVSMIGIREKIDKIRRPLLNCRKQDILKYVEKNNLIFFEDPTNNDYSFRRNKVRRVLLPILKKDKFLSDKITTLNNASISKISKLKKKISSDLNFLKKNNLESCVLIDYNILNSYDYVEMKIFFQTIFKRFFKLDHCNANKYFWTELKHFIETSKVGATFSFLNSLIILKERNNIVIYDSIEIENINNKKTRVLNKNNWGLGKILTLKDTDNKSNDKFECFVDQDIYKKGVYLRSWKFGDKVKLSDGRHKKVSDIFIDAKVPLFRKKIHPIVEDSNNEIVWIPGLFDKNNFSKARGKVLIKWEE